MRALLWRERINDSSRNAIDDAVSKCVEAGYFVVKKQHMHRREEKTIVSKVPVGFYSKDKNT